jgi:hypothetical protein
VLAVRALIGAAPVPTAPALDRREAAAVSWLLGQTGWHGPSVLTPEEETACARGWGMPCPGGDHTDGCPVAAGWEHVAVGRLWSYTHGDAGSDPMLAADQPHPFTTAGLLGPWPRCWPRHLHGWYRQTLPPP